MQARHNKKINGIQAGSLGNIKYCNMQMIHDYSHCLTKNQLTQYYKHLVNSQKYLVLKINFEKSEVLHFSDIRYIDLLIETNLALKLTKEPLKILGISITPNFAEVVDKNINPVIEKMCNVIKIWGQRKLTLFGKIMIIKSLIESQLIYRLSVLPTPKWKQWEILTKYYSIVFGIKSHIKLKRK